MQWTVLKDPEAVAKAACARIVQTSREAIRSRGAFHIVLAGGTTPAHTYALLAEEDCDWENWHIWFGDERCLPPDDPDRNSVMVENMLTSKVAIPGQQVHIIAAESGPELAVEQYTLLLEKLAPFDMVLLGIGEDGHTASLFPGHEFANDRAVLPVYNAPKYPAQRVTLSPVMLSRCRHLLFIVAGRSKSAAVSRWQRGEKLPVSLIRAIEDTVVLIDQQAAPENNPDNG